MAKDDEPEEQSVPAILAEAGWKILSKAYGAARKFSRKKSKREQKEQLAKYDQNHHPMSTGECVVCGEFSADAKKKCPGPPAVQQARSELERDR